MNKLYFIQTMICVLRPFCVGICTKLESLGCNSRLLFPSFCLPLKSYALHPLSGWNLFLFTWWKVQLYPALPVFSKRDIKKTFNYPGSPGHHMSPLCKSVSNFGPGETDHFTRFILKLKLFFKRQEDIPEASKGRHTSQSGIIRWTTSGRLLQAIEGLAM